MNEVRRYPNEARQIRDLHRDAQRDAERAVERAKGTRAKREARNARDLLSLLRGSLPE